MKCNEHKKLTKEDKFGRKYYCQRAARFIKHVKKANNKKYRQLSKKRIGDDVDGN